MPKSYCDIEYYTCRGRKYKNPYENLGIQKKSSYIPRETNRRCKSLIFFTKTGDRTYKMKNAFSKEDIDNFTSKYYSFDSKNDEVFYPTSFPGILKYNEVKKNNEDQIDSYLNDNKNFKLPSLNILNSGDNNDKMEYRKKSKVITSNIKLPSIYKPNNMMINNEINNELKEQRKRSTMGYNIEDENFIDKSITINENRRLQKLGNQIDELLYIIERNNKERNEKIPQSEFYCPKRSIKPSLNKLIRMD
uniref:FLYWCH-type domain-containing protein n=1 Tax=Parastrongyloides trichosuri TaxID=131310 RepID=A0A0N4Z7E9_PARTI